MCFVLSDHIINKSNSILALVNIYLLRHLQIILQFEQHLQNSQVQLLHPPEHTVLAAILSNFDLGMQSR